MFTVCFVTILCVHHWSTNWKTLRMCLSSYPGESADVGRHLPRKHRWARTSFWHHPKEAQEVGAPNTATPTLLKTQSYLHVFRMVEWECRGAGGRGCWIWPPRVRCCILVIVSNPRAGHKGEAGSQRHLLVAPLLLGKGCNSMPEHLLCIQKVPAPDPTGISTLDWSGVAQKVFL